MEKSDLQRFRNECVAAHNFYRAAHGTPPLCWSSRLAESAQSWAQHLASSGSPRYSSEKDIGENFVCLWGSELNGQKVTRIWYEEGKYFDYNKPRVSSRTRSFCQVVWEGTREVGAGAAFTKYGKQIVVARYFPPMSKKDVAKNVKKARSTQDNEQPLAYDTRWSRLYLGLKEFHEECLSVHNEYRLRHGAAPLQWSAELAWEAQQWAENLARSGELRHNDDDTVGENLAGMMGGELSGRETTDMWYDEIEDYDFDHAGYSEDTSNFTQVVWVASESLGVGRAIDGDLCVVVAFYEPPGNMEGSFADNVLRMGSAVRERKSKELKGFVPPAPDLESFRLECLVTHNYFRARHGSPPLVLSSVLTDEAQYWAERLLVTGAMEGLDNSRIGISVAVLDKAHISGIKVSELWYKEILNYDFDSPGFSNETLDFSQLVWLSSRKLGVGKATGADGVTVVVARYEPVGNIDGLFVQNVKRRGHERGSCEPMIFHVEYRYRVRTDSKSTNSFLSWENEDPQTFVELEGDATKRSDLDQFDENENILHRADEQESANTLSVSDHFTRLVWIDPNSPTLQRKGVAEETAQEEDDDEPEDEREQEEEEDARTAYEMDNASEEEDLTCVTEEPLIHTEEAELEEADLFSDPEDDIYQHFCEIRRSLSLDSDGTEPEVHKGNVLSKIAFFETYQHGRQSPCNSESSLRRSLIQEELEELASLKKRQSVHKEEREEEEEEIMEEEHECQLEFDDVFPAHREGDEVESHVEIFDDEGKDEDESLVSVSDAEDVLDYTDCETRQESLQDYEFEDSVCVTHEFMEVEPSAMEIFDFSDEDASHQYADITEEEEQPRSSTKIVYASTNLSTATEFQKMETFKLCEDEPPNFMEDAPDNYREERFETSEAVTEVPQASFQRTADSEVCYLVAKQDHVNIRMEDLISRMGLSSTFESEETNDEISCFHETMEGKFLENLMNNKTDREQQQERTPVDEICDASLKDSVESGIDFEALFKKLENGETENEKAKTIHETSMEGLEKSESLETVQVVFRDHESERTGGIEQVSVDIGLVLTSSLEDEQGSEPDIPLDYECKTSTPVDLVELAPETIIESSRRDRPPENTMNLKELQVRVECSIEKEDSQQELTQDRTDTSREKQSCEAVPRDYDQEVVKVLEETGLELDLVTVSSDITHSFDEYVEPLCYNHTPKSSTVIELPEIAEHIEAKVRRDVQSEINFEEMFRHLDDDTAFVDRAAETRRLEEAVTDTDPKEDTPQAALYVEENGTVDEAVHFIPSSSEYVSHESRQTERTEEIIQVKQGEQRKPTSLCLDENAAADDIATETRSSPKCIAVEGASVQRTKLVSGVNETQEEQCASLFVEEDSIVNEVVQFTPSSQKHIVTESRSVETFGETHEEATEESHRASVFLAEDTLVDEVRTDTSSSPKHIVGESLQAEFIHAIDEEPIQESKRISLFFEVTTVTPSSPKHIAGESRPADSFDEINEEPIEERKKASVFFEVEPLVHEVTTDTLSSPKHIAGVSREAESFDEISEEPIEESKRASVFFEVEPLVDEVATNTSSSPKHIAGVSRQAESFDEINEESMEESKRASVFFEVHPLVDEVAINTPSSPKHIAGESRQAESFDEVNEESIDERKRASVFFEVEPLVEEVATDASSSPKHIAGVSRQAESFDEINEEPIEESKRASVFYEVQPLVDEVATDKPPSPEHLAGESRQAESFDEVNEEPNEERKRASVFFELEPLVDEVATEMSSSPKHIAGVSRQAESFNEINEEPIEESKRALAFFEVQPLVDEVATDTPSSPKQIAGESRQAESFDEVNEEPIDERERASVFLEVVSIVDEVTSDTLSSPKYISGESQQAAPLDEIKEEPIEESKRTSVFFEVEPLVDKGKTDTPSSLKQVAGESYNHAESFEEIYEQPVEDGERALSFLEEDTDVEVETGAPSTPEYIVGESRNAELFKEVDEEPSEESRRASLYAEEVTDVVEVEIDTTSSPKHNAGESRNIEYFEEVEEALSEESKHASMFVEEHMPVHELISDIPSSPKHLAYQSVSLEIFEEIAEATSDENKRASLFVQEDSSVNEVTITGPSVPIHIAGEVFDISTTDEIHEEATPDVEHARELEETYEEASYDYVSMDIVDRNNYVAGEFTSSELLEVTADDESPESDFGEQCEEFESIRGTQRFIDSPQSAHIAGEIKNIDTRDEALEEVLQVEGRLAYEESQELITTTQILKTSQPSFHVADELSNIEPLEESSEEEKPDEGVRAEEIEETEVLTTIVVLKSPQSLLSIAAAAMELKIDAAQQEGTEVVETRTETAQQYDEQERTELPVIFVNIAGEVSENEKDNAYYVEEGPQDDYEIETERYDNGKTVVSYPTEDQKVSHSHMTADFCESEFTLEIEDVEERREFAEPFEESEEGSVSELISECSSSPLHVSSELRDFQDYETINEEYGIETYCGIPYEESDYVSEKSVSKGLPSLYITEELSPQRICEENVLNEKSVVIETAPAYHEAGEPSETESSFVVSEPPLKTAAEFSDSDYHAGAEEDDDLSEKDFLEEFEELEGVFEREIPLVSSKEPASVVTERVKSGPQIAEEEDERLDETDNAFFIAAQDPLVGIEHYTRTVEQEPSVLQEEKIQEEVSEIKVKEGSQVFELNEEKGFASEFTVVSETEKRSVEIKSTGHQVVESKHGEQIFIGEKARQMETSYDVEQKVEVLATKTTRQVSSTDSYVATGSASEEIRYKAEKNGGEGILHEEFKKFQDVSFTPIHQTSKQTSWEKRENVRQFETTDELSESVLEKEAKNQESEKFEKHLSEDETEVRLLKTEVMECKAAEQQTPLMNPHVTLERETTFVKSFIVHSVAKDAQEIQQVVTQDDVLVILKDDEASLEEESAGEQFEEEIDIMRMDEALSEEEFRGEVVESIDRSQARSSKAETADATDNSDREEESDIYEGDQQVPIYEEEVEISEVRLIHEQAQKEGSLEEVTQPDREESYVPEGYQQEPFLEEEVEISEVQPIYEKELAMQKLQEQVETSPKTNNGTLQASTFEEEVEVSAYERSDESAKENLERKPVKSTELRTHPPEFEEELEVRAFQEAQEPAEKVESSTVPAVFQEVDISNSRETDEQGMLSKDEERETTDDIGISERWADEENSEQVDTKPRRQPLDLSQVDLYEDDQSTTTRYYVELSSTESLEPAYDVVEGEASYTERYVRQGDPLEENVEEFILVRYSDEFESSGEEDISDHREIYVIPEEENDVENNVVESAKDDLKAEKEHVPEGFFQEGFENMALEEIRESPEFGIHDSPEDELDDEEQRQLEEYERLESFVILEEKLSQVESDEDCDDENACVQGEEGDEDVFHSDVHSSSEETLHEDELVETMTSSWIRQAAEPTEVQAKEEERADYRISENQEHSAESLSREQEEMTTQESSAESTMEDTSGEKGDKEDLSLSEDPPTEKDVSESSKTKDQKTEQNLSCDSSGEQSISSDGSLSSTPSVDLEELDDFEQNCLLEHNLYRRQHRVKPLKWSDELAANAKDWAAHMASVNCLERCDGKALGQNLLSVHGKDLNGSEVVEMWYKEATDYNFEVPAYNAKCGNFTQVVWASSRELGVAKCVADDGMQYVAALYKPAGNIVGEFKDNVKAPRDSSGRLKRRRSSARTRSRSGLPPVTPAEREKFKTECVVSHNYYRTFHNAPPLRWSPLLAAEAQNYAERLVKTNSLTHSGQKDRGENLAYTWDSSLTARGAVDMWYDEVQDYDFDCPGYTSDTSHFTQLVWVGTEEFGMGMAVARDGRNVVVGRYFPPGNIVGQFKENVRPREIAGIP